MHTKCYMPCCLLCTATKRDHLLFILPPTCFIPCTTAASTWLIYNCILTVELLKILTFYAISVCFWLQKPLKSKTLQNLCPALCFPSYPYSYWPLLSNSGQSVFTCQRINPAICAFQAFYDCLFFVVYFILFYFIYISFA